MDSHYDHPVLWNEERKRFEERQIAQEGIREWRNRKEFERLKTIDERKEYQKMTNEYCPWGRKGGGAPNQSVRMKNIHLDGLYPETFTDCRNVPLPFRFKSKGGGGGAPIRSASGKMQVPFRDDPILGFCDSLRNYVDIELRYKNSPKNKKTYKQQLDQLVAEKENNRISQKRKSIDIDTKLKMYKSPWGRPGPGGNPWRHPRSVGNKFYKSLGWTDKSDLNYLDAETIQVPPIGVNKPKENKITMSDTCSKCICSCLNDMDGNPINMDFNEPKAVKRKNSKPKIKSFIEPKARPCMITGGVELVPLLAKRRAQERTTSLSTTDVTRYKDGKDGTSEWKDGGIQYLTELNRQISRKQRDIEQNKQIDVESSLKHHDTWNAFWGRPGGGAPRPVINKLNLNDLLYKNKIV